jgi:hypothetical protein
MSTYEQALRDCLRDCGAILQTYLEGKLRFEAHGQVKAIIHDIDLLLGREDCRNYDYKKDNETDDEIIASETRARHLWHKGDK